MKVIRSINIEEKLWKKLQELVKESQDRITQLTQKYREISKISGLPTRMDRLKVAKYRRISAKKLQ